MVFFINKAVCIKKIQIAGRGRERHNQMMTF